MSVKYWVYILHPVTGKELKLITAFADLGYAKRVNAVGSFSLTFGGDFDLKYAQLDGRVCVWRKVDTNQTKLDFVGLIRYADQEKRGKQQITTLKGHDLNYLLDGHIVAYAAGTAYAEKSSTAADNLMKALVRENMGALATDTTRDLSAYLTVEADTGKGTVVDKSCSRQNLLTTLREVSASSWATPTTATFFGIAPIGKGHVMQFKTGVPQWGEDHRYPGGPAGAVLFDSNRPSLSNPVYSDDRREERTYIYAAGQGEGSNRQSVEVSDTTRMGASPFNRREDYFDGRNYATTARLTTAAKKLLAEGVPIRAFNFDVEQIPGLQYGVDYELGDQVTATYGKISRDYHIAAVEVHVTRDGETVRVYLEEQPC